MNQIIDGLTSAENTCSDEEVYTMPWDDHQEPSHVDLKKILDEYPINDAIDFNIMSTESTPEPEIITDVTQSQTYANNSSLAIALLLMTSFGIAAKM